MVVERHRKQHGDNEESSQQQLVAGTNHDDPQDARQQDHKLRHHHVRQNRTTKKPSSRLKRERQFGQWSRIRKGPRAIRDCPQAGQSKRRASAKTLGMDLSPVVI